MRNKTLVLVLTWIGLAALARLLPHPPNVTPVAAMALFAGCYLADRRWACAVPLLAMLLTDVVLGFHSTQPYVYAAFLLMVGLGRWLSRHYATGNIVLASLSGSLLFFALTNYGVWATQNMYPHTAAGLVLCYIAALPFFHYTALGDLFYSALLFGTAALLLRPRAVNAAQSI
ncbi:MAG TPA: DUF6580 family putative transport protein [Gammaproteobacteria bacterium]|nr:DUF6580 family putative transport protein [Gammaproteobacteria bacterium]